MYQNITGLTGGASIVQAIATFAAAAGWTVHRDQADGTGFRIATFSAPGLNGYFTIRNTQPSEGLVGNMHYSYNSALSWNSQPDQYYQTNTFLQVNFPTTPINSIFAFGGLTPAPYLYFAVEMAPGYYRHIDFCHFVKFDPVHTRAWAMGCAMPSIQSNELGNVTQNCFPFVYATTGSNRWFLNGGMGTRDAANVSVWAEFNSNQGKSMIGGYDGAQFSEDLSSINTFNRRTELVTPEITQIENGLWIDVGTPPNMRFINIENYQPKDEITLGSDVWKLFPFIRKLSPSVSSSPGQLERSLNYGVAYLKI